MNQPQEVKICDGNKAGAYGVMLARPDVIAVYPITPQTSLIEHLTEWKADGILEAELVEVEGEISAMATALGAAAAGGRVFTATSSMGLNFMFDTYLMAGLSRVPIVMVDATREQSPPSVVAAGGQDIMTVIESGWIHIHTESCQEILDSILMAYRLSEDPDILMPVTVVYDGYYLSFLTEAVQVPSQESVDRFLPRHPRHQMGFEQQLSFGFGDGSPRGVAETRHRHQAAFQRSKGKMDLIDGEFERVFGRSYGGQIAGYRVSDADIVLITIGSCTGTARVAVDRKREEGVKVGLIKIRSFRPFPVERLARSLAGKKAAGVIDRSVALGWNCGHIYREVLASLHIAGLRLPVLDFIDGLGGGDITIDHVEQAIDSTNLAAQGRPFEAVEWLQLG